ncbi:hypothetical protein HPB49_011662 [Dermacentor silvarum]|uniref:Uncharacterized protein n=1 Tax=Dermacentor silvarum TaxID=543639 RepID=A0ACB8DZ91_DERSI|nr:hypothetical protein HPB49_011662 [Dermacentor silvarum]
MPYARTMLYNQLSPTILDDEDDNTSAGKSSFDQGGFLGTLGSAHRAPRRRGRSGEESAIVVVGLCFRGRPPARACEAYRAFCHRQPQKRDGGPFTGLSSRHGGFIDEHHLGELWRSLSAAVKEPYQRKAAEAAIVHRRNHPDYVYNPREAHQHKGQERRAKAVVSKPKNGLSGDQEQQPSISTAVAQDRGFQEFQHPPPPSQRNECRGTSAACGGASGALVRECRCLGGRPLSRPRRRLARLCGPTMCTGSPVLFHRHYVGRTEKTLCPPLC